jgi:hypothetical protein
MLVSKPGPFEIRSVELAPRRLVLVRSERLYTDAVLIAEALRDEGVHAVVWWPEAQRVLFDSRPQVTRELES